MADKPSRTGKMGPIGSTGDTEDTPKNDTLKVTPITNRGYPGGRDLESLVNAENVEVPGVDFANKNSGMAKGKVGKKGY